MTTKKHFIYRFARCMSEFYDIGKLLWMSSRHWLRTFRIYSYIYGWRFSNKHGPYIVCIERSELIKRLQLSFIAHWLKLWDRRGSLFSHTTNLHQLRLLLEWQTRMIATLTVSTNEQKVVNLSLVLVSLCIRYEAMLNNDIFGIYDQMERMAITA